jgi:hypothetical protein
MLDRPPVEESSFGVVLWERLEETLSLCCVISTTLILLKGVTNQNLKSERIISFIFWA